MKAKEKAVRDAAAALQSAVIDARAEGLIVHWPRRFEDLAFIAISEGGKAATISQPVVGQVEPVTFKGKKPDA